MTIYERLGDETREKLKAKAPCIHRPKEELTEEDILELMGTSRQTYKKVKGRVRQR